MIILGSSSITKAFRESIREVSADLKKFILIMAFATNKASRENRDIGLTDLSEGASLGDVFFIRRR